MSNEILKTSKEWAKEVSYAIIDPDGWDRSNFNYSFNQEKITFSEFNRRSRLSTIIIEANPTKKNQS